MYVGGAVKGQIFDVGAVEEGSVVDLHAEVIILLDQIVNFGDVAIHAPYE